MEEFHLNLRGAADQAARFLQRESLMDRAQRAKFVDVFRTQPDGENYGWRGEYRGKSI